MLTSYRLIPLINKRMFREVIKTIIHGYFLSRHIQNWMEAENIVFLLKYLFVPPIFILKAQQSIDPNIIIRLDTFQWIYFIDKAAQILIILPGFVLAGKPVLVRIGFHLHY